MNLFNKRIDLKDQDIGHIQYMGCKNKISFDLIEFMYSKKPFADTFFDLFGGGGAVTFRALYSGYNVFYNEYSKDVYTFINFVVNQLKDKNKQSKYGILPEDFYFFVEKEDFKRSLEKEDKTAKDVFNLIYYSFGNSMGHYYCSEDKINYKRDGHNMVVFNKESKIYIERYNFFKNHIQTLSKLKCNNWQEKRSIFRDVILKLEAIRVTLLYSDVVYKQYKDLDFENFLKLQQSDIIKSINQNLIEKGIKVELKNYKKAKQKNNINRLYELKQLEQLQQLNNKNTLSQINNLKLFNFSYEEMEKEILKYDNNKIIIYCDPPYRNTIDYNKTTFDFNKFDEWLQHMRDLKYDVFISEYTAPKNTKEVFNIFKQNNYSPHARLKENFERLFLNKVD